jgi:hypothetical protein
VLDLPAALDVPAGRGDGPSIDRPDPAPREGEAPAGPGAGGRVTSDRVRPVGPTQSGRRTTGAVVLGFAETDRGSIPTYPLLAPFPDSTGPVLADSLSRRGAPR